MPRGDLIFNPSAGRFPSGYLAERAANVLREYGWEIDIFQTLNGPHITRLARQAAEQGKDALFVVGGDGSVSLAVRGLYGSTTALGVLPGGTSNVFAQELGLRGLTWTRIRALERSAGCLARGTIREVDLGLAGNLPFLLWSGIGLDAYLTHKIEPRKRWEKDFSVATYFASSVWNAQFYQGLNLKVKADGQVVQGHYLVAIMGNISLYAGGLARLSPYALLDDGIFEMWLLEGNTVGDAIQRFLDVVAGRHMESPYAYCVPFHNLELESDKPLYVQLDAEPIDYDRRSIQISVVPKALRLIIPEHYPRRLFTSDPEENDEGRRE